MSDLGFCGLEHHSWEKCWQFIAFIFVKLQCHELRKTEYLENLCNAITPDLPTEEPDNSLSMREEHLSTIQETESDELFSDMNDDCTSSDDNSFENIDYVEASPFDSEIFRFEEDNDSFFKKSDTSLSYSDNSLPEFDTFSDHTKETSSGSTTTHADNSLPEYDSFLFEIKPDQGELTSVIMVDIFGEPHVHVPNVLPNHPTLMLNSDFIPFDDSLRSNLKEDPPENPSEVPMADNQTMAELPQAPTEGYEDAIVIPEIAANNFELKHGLINLVQNKQFFGHDKEDPHAHIRYFNKITSTMRVPNFFPPSKTINLRNEITRFQQRFDESFYEAWDRFNDLLRACPYHGFSKLHQLDTFYNALKDNDQDSLNSAAGGNFLDKMPQECLKSSRAGPKFINHEPRQSLPKALLLDKKNQSSAPAQSLTPALVKAVEPNCVTYGGAHSYQNCPATNGNVYRDNIQDYVKANDVVLRNMQNQGQNLQIQMANLRDMLSKFGITTQSGVPYQGPTIPTPSKVVKQGTEVTKDQVQTPSSQSTAPVQPSVIQSETQTLVSEPVVAPVSVLMPNIKYSIPYPLRRDNERRHDQANEQIEKFYKIFKDMSFEISFTDALILMPKFASTLKALIGNKEKLSEMARTPMNEHCSAVILNKLPRKLGDPSKFLIPCEFPGMDECLALADLNRLVSKPIGIAKDVSVKVGVFHFPADFVVVDFEPDPQVPLILSRCFLKTGRALIDVHKGELTLRIENEAITYNLYQTVRYSAKYNQMMENKIDVICEEYSQEVLGFSNVTASGNPTPYDDLIVSTTSPTLTPFGDSDFLLFEEADAFFGLEDDPNSPKINPFYYDPEGDILLLEAILNSEPLPLLPNHEQYLPSFKKKLKVCEANTIKSSVDKPPEVELKDLPPYLEYAFLEGDNKLPVIIAKELVDEEKSALIKVLSPTSEPSLGNHLTYRSMGQPGTLCAEKGGFTVVKNEENELIPTRLVTGWWVCIDYQKLNEATRKDHFPLPFIDQMLERLAGNEFYYFLDGFSGCKDTSLCLNWEKSHFMVEKGIVLGHKISKNRIAIDRAKVDVIAKLPHPITVKDCIKAFQMLKKKLMEAPILIAPNWNLPFELMCDASDFAIGAVLGQRHEKHFKPIHYASKTMTDAESNYTTTEKEMLAVVYAFEKFRSYLIMNKSIVHTDHSALKYLVAKKDAKARLLLWVLLLQEFDLKFLTRKELRT
nr:hypothetical protein [Tanacetum cinerariifolium]